MVFDNIIRSLLKEDEESLVYVDGGELLPSGKVQNDKDYQKTLQGTVPNVMIEVLEDVVRKHGKSVEDCENIQILVDDVHNPLSCSIYFGWDINLPTTTIFSYKGVDTKVTNRYKHLEIHNISLDQLKKLQQIELFNASMKGHELEDLYNL